MARGTKVGALARDFFPGGKLAVPEGFPGMESAKRTQEYIQQGVETIYEATFIYDNTLVAVDILHKEDGKWCLYEVKSTTKIHDKHINDIAVQYYVITGSGLPVEEAQLMFLNKKYVKHGEIEVDKLFVHENVTDRILPLQSTIKNNIPQLLSMLEGEEPNVAMGTQCNKPYLCDFSEYCYKINPPDCVVQPELNNEPHVMEKELKEYFSSIHYPVCHLDFETIMPAIPLFDESRPMQKIPFQYSLHFQETAGNEVKHSYYLATSDLKIDPRKELIKQMIQDTKDAKTIFVYWISFEKSRIEEMMIDFPEFRNELQDIANRLVDLIFPFKKKIYRTETMKGSSSIKKVLPALCPEFSYDDLEIGNGMAASNAFMDLYYCSDESIKKQIRRHLLDYCHLDTYAMVKILEVLQKF